jgi:IclR family acetate operon transcriptional repressor
MHESILTGAAEPSLGSQSLRFGHNFTIETAPLFRYTEHNSVRQIIRVASDRCQFGVTLADLAPLQPTAQGAPTEQMRTDVSAGGEAPDDKYPLRSVGRALDVLQALGAVTGKGMSVGEVADAIGVSRSTAFTLLQTMVKRGFVADARLGGARHYRLGLALVHLGDRAVAEMGITQIATPILQELTEATQLTSRLAVLDDGYAVAIGRVDAPGLFRMSASLGRRELPHCSSVGKALLARLPRDRVRTILTRLGMPRRTEHTIVSQAALFRDLRASAMRGYAFDDEEDNLGVICAGAPIYDRSFEAVAAISVTSLKLKGRKDDLPSLGATVRAYADRISRLLGGPDHASLPPLDH